GRDLNELFGLRETGAAKRAMKHGRVEIAGAHAKPAQDRARGVGVEREHRRGPEVALVHSSELHSSSRAISAAILVATRSRNATKVSRPSSVAQTSASSTSRKLR